MAKQPWLKWFPSDWRGDPKVRLCSWEAGRLWFEMIGIMHEGDPYGHLRIEGRNLDATDLSALLGQSVKKVAAWLADLERNGVFSRDDGCIVSRKMVRDEATRLARAEGGRMSITHPRVQPPKDTLKDTLDGTHIGYPQIPDTRSQKPDKKKPPKSPKGEYSTEFLSFWAAYPSRAGGADKVGAWKMWQARIKAGVQPDAMIAGAKRYALYCFDAGSLRTQYVKQARTFLGTGEHFLEPWTSPPKRGIVPAAGSVNERPQSAGVRSEGWSTAGGQRLESEDERNDKRVDAWRNENVVPAAVLWQQCADEVAEMLGGKRDTFTEVAAKAMISSKFRSRVIAEHLTPKLAAS